MTDPQQKRRKGCLFYGGITGALLVLVLLLGGYLGLRYAKGLVNQLTDTKPVPLPTVQLPEEQLFQLRDRVDTFRQAVRDGEITEPLELSSDELNALIETDPALVALKHRLYVSINGNQLGAQISFPAEDLGLDALSGRFINAVGVFTIGLTNNELRINAESLIARGKPVPRNIMRQIAAQNLATKFNEDPKAGAGLRKLESIEVKDGKLVIVPKH
jgi:hypothetical protein